jgi:hypothetical protein
VNSTILRAVILGIFCGKNLTVSNTSKLNQFALQ